MAEPLSPADERLRALFSYPIFRGEHYCRVVKDLQEFGVDQIEPIGKQELGNIKILGKGCVGMVALGRRMGNRVAVKILREDANRENLRGEAANLRAANAVGVGPTLLGEGEMVLMMEYIEGVFLAKWLQEPHVWEEVAFVLRSLLTQCRRLDLAGLDHGELSDAKKHVIVNNTGVPFIIDFETASRKRACRNLTAMVNYLFFKESISMLIGRFLCLEKEGLRNALREYKREASDETYRKLMSQMGL
jgi:putative serine/threonine protein kinase